MPMASVKLRPGVNTQMTLALNEAGVSESQLIRYKDGLIQKYGGWKLFYPLTIPSTILDIHAWKGTGTDELLLSVATTGSAGNQGLNVINQGSLSDVTPQTGVSNFTPGFSTIAGSCSVTVLDPNSGLSTFDSVFFDTQVAVGGTFLQGVYPISVINTTGSFNVISTGIASSTVTNGGTLPFFTVSSGSAIITVTLPNNNYQAITGQFYPFYAPTTIGNIVIEGEYQIRTVVDSTSFTIVSPTAVSTTGNFTMNSSQAQVTYYYNYGPTGGGGGWGTGPYGIGGWGVGTGIAPATTGTPITATDWTQDNWGEVLLACPTGGPIYTWSPDSAFTTASVINTGPMFNNGIFVSMPQQILVAWGSCQITGVQDPLIVKWSNQQDYTNWVISSQTTAGAFHIPTGSYITGGLQAPTFGVIWTDIDCWIMQYVGGVVIFNFTRVGTGCGLIGKHAAGVIAGAVYWCGTNNFFTLGPNGVQPLPCSVWDFVFQNLNTAYAGGIRCAPNSTFNEINWFFPSLNSTGANDSYVSYNIIENEWTYGTLQRVAWNDISPLGTPIGATISNIYQHEQTNDAAGQPINSSFTTGYWAISDGNELSIVDWILPDMKFGTYSGNPTASCRITFNSLDYPGDTPKTYGPYTFTNTTEYINVRIRGRLLSMTVQTNDLNSFWRIGNIRYRFAPSGRR